MDRAYVMSRQSELESLRLPEERLWKQIAECLRPEDQDFQGQSSPNSAMDEVFDSTPLYALEDFVGGLFGQATNPATRWFSTGVADEDMMRWQPVKEWFWNIDTIIGTSVSSSFSRFYEEAPAWFGDLGAFGLGAMYSEEDIGNQRFTDRAIPLRESYIDVDHRGELDTFHRKFILRGRQVKQKFPSARGVDEQRSYTIIHAVMPNYLAKPGRLGPEGMPWASLYVCEEVADFEQRSGYHEMPYFVPMWARRSGKIYPRGPGHLARPDIRTLNEMERNHLVAAQYAADPMKLLNGEADLIASDFYPGALLPGTMSAEGKKLMDFASPTANLQLSLQQSEQRRQAIRDAFYFSIMQLVNRPQMTATEFTGFQEEKLRQLAPNLERVQGGGLGPFISRRFRMLARARQLPEPPRELNEMPMVINYTSPLAKLQKLATGKAAMSYFGSLAQIAQAKGDPTILDWFDEDAFAPIMHDAYGAAPGLIRSEQRVQEIRGQRMQMQAGQQQLDAASQQAEIAATASHAMQAASLAKGRAA